MKILLDKYPLGSLPNQRTAGRYIDGTYYENLKILAEVITKDMTFLGIISSSTLEVGTGKSAFAQQTGEAWISLVNEVHKLNVPDITMKNIVFKPKDLIERAFQVPRYSVVIVDEWEDIHYWSELGMTLRQFFRKCRQLNLFIMVIIPNFFQLPISYAITRSVFFVDVRFEGKFERGYFRFYNFERKKDLYLYGRKTQNYNIVKPNFIGRFTDGYGVNEKEYRAAKLKDMMDSEEDAKPLDEKAIKIKLLKQFREKAPHISFEQLAVGFGVTRATLYNWLNKDYNDKEGTRVCQSQDVEPSIIYPIDSSNNLPPSQEKQAIAPITI